MPGRDWGAEGVHWTGEPGDEIQRLDYMGDYGGGESPFEGDMAAAIHVARNDFPWVLYEARDPEGEDRWAVTAYAELEQARGALADCPAGSFIFDGRAHDEEELENAPDGNGYTAPTPANALYVHPQPEE